MLHSSLPGARLAGVASAFPSTRIDAETTIAGLQRLFPQEEHAFVRNLVERSGVEQRFLVPRVDELLALSTFTERNQRYLGAAADLAQAAAQRALDRARVDAQEIDVLIDVSCTGISIPALDVVLAPRLGLRSDVRRVPITEAGCAAGALALGLAGTLASTGLTVLVIAVELCSLTLCRDDVSRTNLVSAVIFGDGAAALVVTSGGEGPCISATASHLIPESRAAMGFDVGTHGLRIQLQRELPAVLHAHLGSVLRSFLAEHGREPADVGLHLVHPGGRRILDSYAELFDLSEGDLCFSREALRRYGNLSSASILTVLELALESGVRLAPEKDALLVGVGPGLSLELALLSWS
jgi:alkylresorcinol/alkylpyrone synthase